MVKNRFLQYLILIIVAPIFGMLTLTIFYPFFNFIYDAAIYSISLGMMIAIFLFYKVIRNLEFKNSLINAFIAGLLSTFVAIKLNGMLHYTNDDLHVHYHPILKYFAFQAEVSISEYSGALERMFFISYLVSTLIIIELIFWFNIFYKRLK